MAEVTEVRKEDIFKRKTSVLSPWADPSFNKVDDLGGEPGFKVDDIPERLGLLSEDAEVNLKEEIAQVAEQAAQAIGQSFWSKAGSTVYYKKGRIAIGHADPQEIFHIAKAQQTLASRISCKVSPWRQWECLDSNYGFAWGIAADDKKFHLHYDTPMGTVSAHLMCLDGLNSRVGILQDNPSYPFDVNGAGRFDDLYLNDTNASHVALIHWNENETSANRTLNFTLNGGDRTFALHGNLTVESASIVNQDLTTDFSPTFVGLNLSGELDLTGVAACIDLNPAGTGTKTIIDLTPSAALIAGRTWDGIYINVGALDPATGDPCTVHGFHFSALNLASTDYDAEVVGFLTRAGAVDDFTGFQATITEATRDIAQNAFLAFGGDRVLSATAKYRGLYVDYDGLTRNAGAPILEGVRIKLPANYANFGTSFAGYFEGDGRSVTLCDTTYALTTSGAMNLVGSIIGVTTLACGKLTVNSGEPCSIILKGTSSGIENRCWIGFYDSDGTTRRGYVGDASDQTTDIVLAADGTGDVKIKSTGGNVILLSNDTLALTLDASQNATFAGTITVANGASISLQEDITFTGATAQNLIKFPDNLPTALDFREGATSYLLFRTSDGTEGVTIGKPLTLSSIAVGEADYDKFLVSHTGLIKYRTGAQVLGDIGAALSGGAEHDGFSDFEAGEHFTMLDEDDLTSNSNTKAATQQSIKAYVDASGGGASVFVDLTDTPANYSGAAGKLVRVNATPDALEFIPQSALDHGTIGGLADVGDHNWASTKTTGAWTKSIGAGGDYADWATMIAAMPDLIAHAVTVTIKAGTTLTEICRIKNKHGLTSASVITTQAEKYFPTSGVIPTADSATATTLRDAALATAALGNDYFNGCWIFIVHGIGTDNGFVLITDYIDATGDVVVASWPGTQPDATSRYLIVGAMIDGSAERNALDITENTVSIKFRGIGMKDTIDEGIDVRYCHYFDFFWCGVYNAGGSAIYLGEQLYAQIRYSGFVKSGNNGIALTDTSRGDVNNNGISDNVNNGIVLRHGSYASIGNNFGDNNGGWGTDMAEGSHADFEGTECSGALGTHRLAPFDTINLEGGQIKFPAAQQASADPNTLDDYEEGTWTPSIGGNTSYTQQIGEYTKIGNLVHIRFTLQINVLGTGSTHLMTGIPFNGINKRESGSMGYWGSLAANVISLYPIVNVANITFISSTVAGGAATDATAIFGNGTLIFGTVTYHV